MRRYICVGERVTITDIHQWQKDQEQKSKEGPIAPVKEEPIYQSDKDPTNNSGCIVS